MAENMTGAAGSENPMLDKIRKLLAKAENPACTPAEAEVFTAKAAELIAKYGIDEALLAAADAKRDVVGDRTIRIDAPYALDKRDLLVSVAFALRCKAVNHWRRVGGTKYHSVELFGFTADLDRVELLYTSLLIQSASALAATEMPWDVYGAAKVAAWRRSWLAGYRTAVARRLRAAEKAAADRAQAERSHGWPGSTAAGPSVALVLVERSTLVERAHDEKYPKLKKTPRRSLSGEGQMAGYRAGQTARLGGVDELGAKQRTAVGG